MGRRRWRDRNIGASWLKILWWEAARLVCGVLMAVFWRFRWWGAQNVPQTGGMLLVCNHQSYLDLIALGVALPRRQFHSMARASLFKNPVFAALIRSLNAFPVDQNGSMKAMRTAIERLKQGQVVLIFPEGSRTADGRLAPFERGISLVIRRARPIIVPAAVDGLYDIWPIHGCCPGRGRAGVKFGEPIDPDTLLAMGDEEATVELYKRIDRLRLDVREQLRRNSRGRFPRPGPADEPARVESSTV